MVFRRLLFVRWNLVCSAENSLNCCWDLPGITRGLRLKVKKRSLENVFFEISLSRCWNELPSEFHHFSTDGALKKKSTNRLSHLANEVVQMPLKVCRIEGDCGALKVDPLKFGAPIFLPAIRWKLSKRESGSSVIRLHLAHVYLSLLSECGEHLPTKLVNTLSSNLKRIQNTNQKLLPLVIQCTIRFISLFLTNTFYTRIRHSFK